MSVFSLVKEQIHKNAERSESGKFNCIPFPIKTLNKYIPGIMRGYYYSITAGTGVGKTKFAKFAFVKAVYDFYKEHPDSGIKPKVMYFLLEESKEEFIQSLIIDKLWSDHNVRIDAYDLKSYRGVLSDDIRSKIEDMEDYFADLESIVYLHDTTANPTGK